MLEDIICELRRGLINYPNPCLIFAARWVMTEFDREGIPDWIALLAGGNYLEWDMVFQEVVTELSLSEEMTVSDLPEGS